MYFTPRGKDQRRQKIMDFSTAQRLLEILVSQQEIKVFFEQVGIRRIGIAPFNYFGQCMVRMLKDSDIEIKCFMDRRFEKFNNSDYFGIPVKNYGSLKNDDIDAVIVASNFYCNDIMDSLIEHNISIEKIIGINTVLYGMERLKAL